MSPHKISEEINDGRLILVNGLDVIFAEFYQYLNNVRLSLTGKLLNPSSEALVGSNISIMRGKSFGSG